MWWTKYIRQAISLCLFFSLGAVLAPPLSPAAAQTTNIPNVTFRLAWDGMVEAPGWTELQVTLQNEAGDWEGELLLVDTGNLVTYHQALSLPAHSRKYYRIPLYVSEGWGLEMQLQDAGGQRVYQQTLIFNPAPASPVCGIADSQGLLASDVTNVCASTFLIQDLTWLPETPMAWDSLDILLINGLDTSELTAQQQSALIGWVANGGRLSLSGGAALPQTLAGLPDMLRIATPGAVQTFTGLDTVIAPESQVTAPALDLGPNATPILSPIAGAHLTAQQSFGEGSVTIIAWDVVQAHSLDGLSKLWKEHFKSEEELALQTLSNENYFNTQWLFAVPGDKTPQLWRWLLFFPIYILLIGPLTWFLVRRLKRPVLAWSLLPAWIVLAILVVALGLNGAFGSSFPLVHEIAAIHVRGEGLPAHVLQGTAIYAPRTRQIHWHSHGVPRPLYGNYVLDSSYNEGDPYPVDVTYKDGIYEINVSRPFGVITWGAEGTYVPPMFQSALSIITSQEAPMITGTLQGEVALRNVTLLMGNGQYALHLTDILTAGMVLNITESLTRTYTSYYYGQSSDPCGTPNIYPYYPGYMGKPTSMSTKLYLESLYNAACRITAVVEGVPFPAQDIGGVHVAESCLIYTVPCPTQTPGVIHATLRGNVLPVSGGWANEDGSVQMSAPTTELTYILPEFLNIRTVQVITLTMEAPDWWSGPTPFDPAQEISQLALWDWQEEQWVAHPLPTAQAPLVLNEAAAQRFFEPHSGLQVRLETQTGDNSIKLTVQVTGTW